MGYFPDNVMTALKEAVVKVFWTKDHLRSFLAECGVPEFLIAAQDWDRYKYHIVDPILMTLNESQDGLGPLRRILAGTLSYSDCSHLLRWQDGQRRKREAEAAVERLYLLVEKHDRQLQAEREELSRRRAEVEKQRSRQVFYKQLDSLRERFLRFYASKDKQARGYDLERFLYDLFSLFDLQPRGPFRLRGEQIDGAFVLDGDDFLLEAKWQESPVTLNELRDLDGAVASNLDNTLGLFVSINGFSEDALQRYREGGRPRLICMDGADIVAVLENHIDLPDLLRRKKQIASQQGSVFVSAHDILQGVNV